MIDIPLDIARAAELEVERPGYWWQPTLAFSGDGRELSQEHTDIAIALGVAREICRRSLDDGAWQDQKHYFERVAALWIDQPAQARLLLRSEHTFRELEHAVNDQRGGVHSDPLVRAYARHMWGDRDAAWDAQPICACGHEAGLHVLVSEAYGRSVATYKCAICPITMIESSAACHHSEERVRELAGPICTCPTPWNAEAPGRFVRTNAGGRTASHSQLQCEKGRWYQTLVDTSYLRAGVLTPEEVARSRFNPWTVD